VNTSEPAAKKADWERIEQDYRAGLLSVREIAASQGITHGAINKRAKLNKWERDLTAKIKAKADALVSKREVSTEVSTEQVATDRAIIEANAEVIANIRLAHRKDIGRARKLAMGLLDELELQTDNRDAFYAENPAQFITDWGMTFDPRNAGHRSAERLPVPPVPEAGGVGRLAASSAGRRASRALTEKSRDMGMSWLTVGTAAPCACSGPGWSIGYGSRKEDYVDKIGDPKSLFWKARYFMRGAAARVQRRVGTGHARAAHADLFPDTGSAMTGEAGDNIGRGDRTTAFYFVDESAHLERPQLVDASLSQTTNCRQDLSSVNGRGNPFARSATAADQGVHVPLAR
jgi:hypothetical protein